MTQDEFEQALDESRDSRDHNKRTHVIHLYRAAIARAEAAEAENDILIEALELCEAVSELRELRPDSEIITALRAQLAALQHAACPHCGKPLQGEKLAPF